MAATLDGLVKETGAVFEAKFMLPWSFSEEGAAEKHMAQLQHNMLGRRLPKKSVLSIINGGGKWVDNCRLKPIRSTRQFLLRLRRPFGGRSRPAKLPHCLTASLRNHGSKRSVSST